MTRDQFDDPMLDDLFAKAREDAQARPSHALLQRVQADAHHALDMAISQTSSVQRRPSLFSGVVSALGGWTAVSGLATATLAGIWIGFGPLDGDLSSGIEMLNGTQDMVWLDDLSTGYEFLSDEG